MHTLFREPPCSLYRVTIASFERTARKVSTGVHCIIIITTMTDSSSSIDLLQDDDSNDINNKGTTFDLGLDIDENHALRFLSLPPPCQHLLLAYGGDTGEVFCIIENDKKDNNINNSTLVRRWEEDAVRCMAASPSGQYIAVGLEDGSSQIYIYPKSDITATFHPFVGKLDDDKNDKPGEEEREDTLLSQSDSALLSPRRGEHMVYGPSFTTPNKDMIFLNEDYLGIAHEEGFCIVAMQDMLHSSTTAGGGGGGGKAPKHYLEEEQKEAHRDSGCRGFAWMPDSRTLVSLAMDGHACFWDLTSLNDPTQWKLLKREVTKAITKKDAGEMLDDGDVWGRSCRPALDFEKQLLALPGEPYWQIRTIEKTPSTSSSSSLKVVQEQTLLETTLHGHVESMVVLRSSPHANDPYWVSTGRDGRVIVWKANKVTSLCFYLWKRLFVVRVKHIMHSHRLLFRFTRISQKRTRTERTSLKQFVAWPTAKVRHPRTCTGVVVVMMIMIHSM
jgi:hypothetical protein